MYSVNGAAGSAAGSSIYESLPVGSTAGQRKRRTVQKPTSVHDDNFFAIISTTQQTNNTSIYPAPLPEYFFEIDKQAAAQQPSAAANLGCDPDIKFFDDCETFYKPAARVAFMVAETVPESSEIRGGYDKVYQNTYSFGSRRYARNPSAYSHQATADDFFDKCDNQLGEQQMSREYHVDERGADNSHNVSSGNFTGTDYSSDYLAESSTKSNRRRRIKYPPSDPFVISKIEKPHTGVVDVNNFAVPFDGVSQYTQYNTAKASDSIYYSKISGSRVAKDAGTCLYVNDLNASSAVLSGLTDIYQASETENATFGGTLFDFAPIQFPLVSTVQIAQVNVFLQQALQTRLSRKKRFLLAAIYYRLGDPRLFLSLLAKDSLRNDDYTQYLLSGDTESAVECLIYYRKYDLALAVAVKHGTSQQRKLADYIIITAQGRAETANLCDNWQEYLLSAANTGFENDAQAVGLYYYFVTNNQMFYAAIVQIAANFALEPTTRFVENPQFSMYPLFCCNYDYTARQTSTKYYPDAESVHLCEIIEFTQMLALSSGNTVKSLASHDLNLLPFYPYLLEPKIKLFVSEKAPLYVEVCIRHLKTILQKLSTKKLITKEPALKKSESLKFVIFNAQESIEWVTKQGQTLYKLRKSGAPVEFENVDEKVSELGSYMEAPDRLTVGYKLGNVLTYGLGKLLGTGGE